MRKRKASELEFDLESVRKIKRLAKRVVRELETIEKCMVKFRKANHAPNDEERVSLEVLGIGPIKHATVSGGSGGSGGALCGGGAVRAYGGLLYAADPDATCILCRSLLRVRDGKD